MHKKLFIVFISLSLLLSSSSFAIVNVGYHADQEFGEDDYSLSSCGSDIFSDANIKELIGHYSGGECLEKWTLNDKCNCIYKKIHTKLEKSEGPKSSGQSLHLSQAVEKSIDNTLKKIEENKTDYWQQFGRSYEKVTVQASAQAEILQLQDGTESEGFVGCTPRLFTAGVKDKLNPTIEKQIDLLTTDKAKGEKFLQKCEEKKDNIKILGLSERQCLVAKQNDAMIKKNIERLEELRKHEENKDCSLVIASLKDANIQNRVNEIRSNENFQKRIESGGKKFPLEELLKDVEDGKIDVSKYGVKDCSSLIARFNQIENLYSNFVKKKIESPQDHDDYVKSQCGDVNDPLCKQMASINHGLIRKTGEILATNPNDCITYAEYTAYQGRPSEDFLKDISRSSNPEKLLDSDEGIVFLKSNPLIGRIANGSDRRELASSLKQMARNVLDQKSEAGKFGAYLDFMKGDFADLYKKQSKSSAMHVCNELASIYTAITISNDDSKVAKEVEEYSDNSFIKLEQVLNRCSAKVQKKIKTSGLEESLRPFKTFLMGSESRPNDEPTPAGFDKLKAEFCSGFASHKEQNCLGNISATDCRKSFKSAFTLYKNKMREKGVKEELDKNSFKRIADNLNETKNDHAFVKYWQQNVGSKLNNNVLAGPKDRGEFAAAMARNHAIMNSPDIMTNYNASRGRGPASDLASIDLGGGSSGNSVGDPSSVQGRGQQEPDWAKDDSYIDAGKYPEAKVPQDLIPGFSQLDPIEKVEALNQVKRFVSQQENPPFDTGDVNQVIKKIGDEIVKEYKSGENKKMSVDAVENEVEKQGNAKFAKKASSSSINNIGAAFSNNSNSLGAGAAVFSGSGSHSVTGGGKMSALEKSQLSHRKALLGKYDNQSENITSGQKGEIKIKLQEKMVNFESIPGLLIDGAAPLVPESHDKYMEIKADPSKMVAYLETNLASMDTKGSKVIRVQDPQESPHAFLLFYVSQKATGEYTVRPIKRQSTLNDLTNTLR